MHDAHASQYLVYCIHLNPLMQDSQLCLISLRIASTETYTTCKYNSECLVRQANQGIIEVGDSILVKAQEALSLSSK